MPQKKISYFHSPDYGLYYYGYSHPMKPFRVNLVHELLLAYGLNKQLKYYRPRPARPVDLIAFHSRKYIQFLQLISPENIKDFGKQVNLYNIKEDCPVFSGLFDYCQLSAGASITAATHLCSGQADICINWMGGMHHAKASEASGFCYVNDIVLGILEMLKVFPRVLYIDIDVHHGDGVEEAFYTCPRVFTLSFHNYGGVFFPGTGSARDIGADAGLGYAANIPLVEGIRDDSYIDLYSSILNCVVEHFKPSAIVLQCGADSLAGDRLGVFNLTLKGHGECVRKTADLGLPMMVLGGGGYTMRNIARCWTYETALLCGMKISEELPYTPYYNYYAPDYRLPILPSSAVDRNTSSALKASQQQVFENVRKNVRPFYGNSLWGSVGIPKSELEIEEMNKKNEIGDVTNDELPETMDLVKELLEQSSKEWRSAVGERLPVVSISAKAEEEIVSATDGLGNPIGGV